MIIKRFYLIYIFLFGCQEVFSNTYEVEMDLANWEISSSIFECKIEQKIPGFGSAYFINKSGEDIEFRLDQVFFNVGNNLKVFLDNPSWRSHKNERKLLQLVNYKKNSTNFSEATSKKLLLELSKGNSPKIQWDVDSSDEIIETIAISLSPINFQDSYEKYINCLNQQMPVGFSQISHSIINFSSNDDTLTFEAKKWLDIIVKFFLISPEKKKIIISGYTDTTHNSYYNKNLSKRRAEAVQDYFLSNGVPIKKMVVNHYGENFPIANNSTIEGRSANRRVSIRISL